MMKSRAAQLAAKLKLTGSKFLAHDARSDQSTVIQKSTQIYKRKVIFELHPFFNGFKLIIYTSCYTPTTALSTFAAGLAKYYGVTEVVQEKWIKPQNARFRAYQITFPGTEIPEFSVILGEQGKQILAKLQFYQRCA